MSTTSWTRHYVVLKSYQAYRNASLKANSLEELRWLSESLDAAFLADCVKVTDDQWQDFTAVCAVRSYQLEGMN